MAVSAALPYARIGDYEILARLGAGGMGVVYKARDLNLQRIVALKMLADDADRDRILREARAASVLDHPNIVAVHSVEQAADGAWFLVMAYYEGQTLEDKLRDGPLPPADAVDVVAQVARGLAHAHEHGLIHRDIKPANIILTPEGRAKIVDFGLARHFDAMGSTQSASFSGTLTYMSPEQIQGGALDARTDLWSLGCVFYHALTGRLPFEGRSAVEQVWAVLHGVPAPLTGISEPLQLIVLRALAKRADARYAACQELLDDLASLHHERRNAIQIPPDLMARLLRASRNAGAQRSRRPLRLLAFGLIAIVALFFAPSFVDRSPSPGPAKPVDEAAAAHLAEGLFRLAAITDAARVPGAVELYWHAISLNPKAWLPHHRLAAYHFMHRDYEAAAAEWRKVIALEPRRANAYSNLGMALLSLGRLDEAGNALRTAVDLERSYANFSNLGILYYEQKRWADSADAYNSALKLNAGDYKVWGNLGLAYEWLRQKEGADEAYRQELSLLAPIAARAPNDASLQSQLALLYSKQRRRAPALAAARRALELAPDDPSVLSNAAETYENLRDRPRAIELVRASLEHGKTLDQLDHNPGLRRLLADPGFRTGLAEHTRNLAARSRQ